MNTSVKTLAMALVAGSLLAGAAATPSYAFGGGGGEGEAPNFGNPCHTANCKHLKKKNVKKVRKAKKRKGRSRPWASAYDPETGRRITSIGNGDGTRTVIGTGIGFGPFGIQIWTSH